VEVEKTKGEVVNGANEGQATESRSQWRVEDPKDHPWQVAEAGVIHPLLLPPLARPELCPVLPSHVEVR
jgi:hypothetical protein